MTTTPEPTLPGDPLPDEIEFAVFDLQALPKEQHTKALEQLCEQHPRHASAIRVLGTMTRTLEPGVPEQIGPYRIVDLLGEGGMGTVYVAEQTQPVKRRIALKVVKLGMDSKAVLARFEVERRALAVMNHDAIARVFDAGSTEQGQPYFAMEFVEGLPLVEYCERHRLGLADRIALFREICAGVHHAHQKGVIHRDLKPGNILVSNVEGRHVPKIIDFGLARATDRDSADWSLLTMQGQMLGTPAYMSPEQAAGNDAEIDTRTDVYALGVMLYELLSGQLPFSQEDLGREGLAGLHRTIREVEPPRPSTRITIAAGHSETHASHCGTTASALRRALRGELDWIVMRAIEKEPARRYGSVSDLSADLARFQNHEPVLARPPKLGYRLQKFARRYRVQVAAFAIVFATLAVGATGVWLSLVEARDARESAETSLSRYELLSRGVKLRNIRRRTAELVPAWPKNEQPLRTLLQTDWRELHANRPGLEDTLQKLRSVATELTPEEEARRRREHPEAAQLTRMRRERDSLRLAQRIRDGDAELPASSFDPSQEASPWSLFHVAMSYSTPNRKQFGREADALAIARHLVATVPEERAVFSIALANALLALGKDGEAKQVMLAAMQDVSPQQRSKMRRDFGKKVRGIRARTAARLKALEESIAKLERQIDIRVSWQLPDDSSQFLHDTLTRLIRDIDAFERDQVPLLERRLAWASRIQKLSIDDHAQRWQEARRAIRAADGIVASEAYAETPIDLEPQVGLVPIGMNPQTKLWEFYHLGSAMVDGSDLETIEIPTHAENGAIAMEPDMGIIFVLVPGGRFLMGAQKHSKHWPAYDRMATSGRSKTVAEEPAVPVRLDPYFLSRFEMTQGQWKQLSGKKPPSFYYVGGRFRGVLHLTVDYNFPVESVSCDESIDLLRQFGLNLPTEAQWERACRADTTTPWSSGASVGSLRGFANLRDQSSEKHYGQNGRASVPWDDGHGGPAAVGTFGPNPWGFHDMHGNLLEWCRDGGSYTWQPEAGDGERPQSRDARTRVRRGGCHADPPQACRTTARGRGGKDWRQPNCGIRPVRRLDP